MKIALLTDGLFPDSIGGIQKHSHSLVKYFSKNNIYVDVYYVKNNKKFDIKYEEYKSGFVNFFENKMPKSLYFPGHYIYNSFRLSKKYYQKLKSKPYDFIYAQGFTSWYFLKKQPFQENLISNLHGLEMYQFSSDKVQLLKKTMLKLPSNSIIKKSRYNVSLGGKLENILLENGATKDSIIYSPNAIELSWVLEELPREKSQKLIFVFIGRYERRKGLKEISKVAGKLIEKNNFEFHFIGEIPGNKKVINDNFYYYGTINDSEKIKRLLINSDILVCPSYSEGMPTVILEAMACGCAIIATDVGAVGTMVDQENGWLISKINLESEIEKAMTNSFLERENLFKKKINSLERVKNKFNWDYVINKKIEILKNIQNKTFNSKIV